MTTLATRTTPPEADDLPVDRLLRLTPEQFRLASEAGAFPEADRVELVDGLLRRGGPNGPLYRLSLDQFHRLSDVPELEKIELLGGWLVARMPINPPHQFATRRARVCLERLVPAGYYVDSCAPSSMPRTDTEPLPDLQVIRGDDREYLDRHPYPAEVSLLVEVSDSTVSFDRNIKWRLYAREGVAVSWIVNLVARRLEAYTDPSGPSDTPGYRQRKDYGPEEEAPLVLDGREVGRIAVRDLLS